jgi:predicted ATPase
MALNALDKVTIRGFKSIRAIENLELRPINVIIGPNGSGKSNFVEAFSFLVAIRNGALEQYVSRAGGANRLLHFGSKVSGEIYIGFEFEERNRYDIRLVPTELDGLSADAENAIVFRSEDGKPNVWHLARGLFESAISKRDPTFPAPAYVYDWVGRWGVYHFHDTSSSSPMKKTADLHDNRALRTDGANVAAFLYLLKNRYATEYLLVRRAVQMVAPFFDDFILEPQRLNQATIRLEWKHLRSDAYFDASALSDGTLRFIALATLLVQPPELRPRVILIDEPELGLHPYAITLLASLIKQASEASQVILSTQSSLLLDHFEPEDVLIADREDGGTVLHRLEPKRLDQWLQDYSLGQLWEKNEIGGRPTLE